MYNQKRDNIYDENSAINIKGRKMYMEYIIREYRPGDEEYAADAHARIYLEEYNWGPAFSDYAAHIACDFAVNGAMPGEQMWVAEYMGKPVGCIMLCRTDEPAVGQLRLLLVEKAYRGSGIGRALINTLISEAVKFGYEKLVLWTAHPLTEAIKCYERAGFVKTQTASNTDWSLTGETVFELKYEKKLS